MQAQETKIKLTLFRRILNGIRYADKGLVSCVVLAILCASILIPPVLTVVYEGVFSPLGDDFQHLKNYLLPTYIKNTLWILLGTCFFSGLLGILFAFWMHYYNFKGKSFWGIALILPMSIPPFIQGYIYSGLTSPLGFFFQTLQTISPENNFTIFGYYGAIFIMSLSFYPYVYLIFSVFLKNQNPSILIAAESLGLSTWSIFFRVILPLGKAPILAGVSLVGVEVLNDFGLMDYLGTPTFSVGIYQAWFDFNNRLLASKLAFFLFLVVLVLFYLKHWADKIGEDSVKNSQNTKNNTYIFHPKIPNKFVLTLVYSFLGLIVFLGVILPLYQEFYWLFHIWKKIRWEVFIKATFTTLFLALLTSILLIILGLIITQSRRFIRSSNFFGSFLLGYLRIASIGYVVPTSILSIGIFLCVAFLNHTFGLSFAFAGVLLLLWGYLVRFYLLVDHNLTVSFLKEGTQHHNVSRTLGKNFWETLIKIDIPLSKPALKSSIILIFIEVVKELTLTINLRPFNTHTLASLSKKYADDGRLVHTSPSSLMIILFCLALLTYISFNKKKKDSYFAD